MDLRTSNAIANTHTRTTILEPKNAVSNAELVKKALAAPGPVPVDLNTLSMKPKW